MSNRPIVVLGAPRSGTTFLGDTLAEHSSLQYFIEPSPVWRYGNEQLSDILAAEHARPEVVQRIRDYFKKECELGNRPRILEKTPQNCLRVPFVDKVFPDAVYVHILRDGYECSLSIRENWLKKGKGLKGVRIGQRMREIQGMQYFKYGWQFFKRCLFAGGKNPVVMWGPQLPGLNQMRKELSLLEVAAMQWKWCTEWAIMDGRALGPDRYLEICLEDLDHSNLHQILEFLDLTPETRVLDFFEKRYSKSATRYRSKEADIEELQSISRIVEPTMDYLRVQHSSMKETSSGPEISAL